MGAFCVKDGSDDTYTMPEKTSITTKQVLIAG
jgi:calcium-dependent protein kinase